MKEIRIESIRKYFENIPEVVLVYLFGSSITGKQHSGSDVDIAVLFTKKPGVEKIFQMRDDLEERLHREVDLVVLNDAPPVLRRQVITRGKEVFCRDYKAKHYFVLKSLNEYDDLKYYQKIFEENMLEKPILAR